MKNVYIILSQTGTLFSQVIRLHTKDPYNHASISFDADLSVMYSFGRRKRYNVLDCGFITENFSGGLYMFFPNARCCVLEISVTDAEYLAMQQAVELFCGNQEHYRYNLMGVMSYTVGVGMTRRNHFFCSQFVSYVLSKTAFWNRVPELTKPMDFYHLPNSRLVFEGAVAQFRQLQWHKQLLPARA